MYAREVAAKEDMASFQVRCRDESISRHPREQALSHELYSHASGLPIISRVMFTIPSYQGGLFHELLMTERTSLYEAPVRIPESSVSNA